MHAILTNYPRVVQCPKCQQPMTLTENHYTCTNDDCRIYLGAYQWHHGNQKTVPLKHSA